MLSAVRAQSLSLAVLAIRMALRAPSSAPRAPPMVPLRYTAEWLRLEQDTHRPGMWWLGDALSGRAVELPNTRAGQVWALDFDDGEPFAYEVVDDPEPVLVRPLLPLRLLEDAQGIVHVAMGTGSGERSKPIGQARRCHAEGTFIVEPRPTYTEVLVNVAVLTHIPCEGFRVRVSLHSIYAAMGFTTYKGSAGRFVDARWSAWENAMNQAQYPHALLRATPYSTDDDQEPDEQRHLAWPSVHWGGFMLLLVRWATHSPATGGLKDDAAREAAAAILEALLTALRGHEWTLRLFVDPRVVRGAPWQDEGHRPVMLQVSAAGMLDPRALAEASSRASAEVAELCRVWLAVPCICEDHMVRIDDFVREVATAASSSMFVKPLMYQVMWSLAMAMENRLLTAMTDDVTLPRANVVHGGESDMSQRRMLSK